MLKRTIAWGSVLAILVGFTYGDYYQKTKPEIEPTVITVYADKDDYGDDVRKELEKWQGKRKAVDIKFEEDYKNANVIFTRDYTKLNLQKNYQVFAYSPMAVTFQDYDGYTNGLITEEKEVNFKKIVDAILEERSWTYFGREDTPIKLYCPKLDTAEGKLFYNLLLVTANEGRYPSTEAEMEKSEQIAKDFLASDRVQETDVVELLLRRQDIGTDIYVLPESDYIFVYRNTGKSFYPFAGYPTTTVVEEIYYQVNEQVKDMFEKELNRELFGDNGSCYNITRGKYYRTSKYREPAVKTSGIKNAFNYVEIPKESLYSANAK